MKIGAIDRALEYLETQPKVHPPAFHTVLSLYVWGALLWRPALSAVFHGFQFVTTHLDSLDDMVELWPSVRAELRLMRVFLGFLSSFFDIVF